VWKKKGSYKSKTEMIEFEPAENVDFGEKGVLKLKYRQIVQLRDFFLDGTQVELLQQKVTRRSLQEFTKSIRFIISNGQLR
jgi:hypothetical protein